MSVLYRSDRADSFEKFCEIAETTKCPYKFYRITRGESGLTFEAVIDGTKKKLMFHIEKTTGSQIDEWVQKLKLLGFDEWNWETMPSVSW